MASRADYETLATLLASLFTADELRRWLLINFPAVLSELPSRSASLSEIIYDTVRVLDRHGLVNETFFSSLGVQFPARKGELLHLASLWRSGREAQRQRTSSNNLDSHAVAIPAARSATGKMRCILVSSTPTLQLAQREIFSKIAETLTVRDWQVTHFVTPGIVTDTSIEQFCEFPLIIAELDSLTPALMFLLGARFSRHKPILGIKDKNSAQVFRINDTMKIFDYTLEVGAPQGAALIFDRVQFINAVVSLAVKPAPPTTPAPPTSAGSKTGIRPKIYESSFERSVIARISRIEKHLGLENEGKVFSAVTSVADAPLSTVDTVGRLASRMRYWGVSASASEGLAMSALKDLQKEPSDSELMSWLEQKWGI